LQLQTIHFSHRGASGVNKLIQELTSKDILQGNSVNFEKYPKVSEFWKLLQVIKTLINEIYLDDIPNQYKIYFLNNISYQFHSKIRPTFTTFSGHRGKRIPAIIFGLVEEIEAKLLPGKF